jgi:predicted secreted hydrolase
MRIRVAAVLAVVCGTAFADYRQALPGYRYEFPRDHFNHPEFRTEWWYYTGNLRSAEGRQFGFELTFFRHNVNRDERRNVWDIDDVWLAHFALSDIDGNRFLHTQRLNRTGAGLAGADSSKGTRVERQLVRAVEWRNGSGWRQSRISFASRWICVH